MNASLEAIAPMDTQQPRRQIPEIQFRVLIIGRANAGKTSILQRVCDTTESPVVYRGNEEVRVLRTAGVSVICSMFESEVVTQTT